MKRFLIAAAAAGTLLAGTAVAQNAEFAAVYTTEAMAVESSAFCSVTNGTTCNEGLGVFDENVGYTVAQIRVANKKELLVGLSAQVGLFTSTEVKGKRGSKSTAIAAAGGSVVLFACPQDGGECLMGQPGSVILDARIQELEAVLAGIIEECTVDVTISVEDPTTGSGVFNLGDCTVADESIRLALSTLSANHFNFVFEDVPVGDYNVVAQFMTAAYANAMASCPEESTYCIDADEEGELGDGSATAISHAFIGKTMMTVQEVRAVKGDGIREGWLEF